MGIAFYQNSVIGELFWHSRVYGYDFRKFLRIYGYTFEKVFRIYGWYFYHLNGTTPYLGNSSYPPPPGLMAPRIGLVKLHKNDNKRKFRPSIPCLSFVILPHSVAVNLRSFKVFYLTILRKESNFSRDMKKLRNEVLKKFISAFTYKPNIHSPTGLATSLSRGKNRRRNKSERDL